MEQRDVQEIGLCEHVEMTLIGSQMFMPRVCRLSLGSIKMITNSFHISSGLATSSNNTLWATNESLETSPSAYYRSCSWRDEWSLLALMTEVVAAIETPFFLIGLFGNIWTFYVLVKTRIAAIVEVRIYFLVIFGSDILFQLSSGFDLYSTNLIELFGNSYWSITIFGQVPCRTMR